MPRRLVPLHAFGFLFAAVLGACEAQEDPCSACDTQSEYCVRHGSDVSGKSATVECVQLPDACADSPTCECLASVPDGESKLDSSLSFCLMQGCEIADDVLRIVCPGG